MKAIHLMFKSRRAIYYSSKDNTYLVRIGAKEDVQKIVDFFSFDNHHPLIGFKKDSYDIWLNSLKESDRYKDLRLP